MYHCTALTNFLFTYFLSDSTSLRNETILQKMWKKYVFIWMYDTFQLLLKLMNITIAKPIRMIMTRMNDFSGLNLD